MVLMHTPRRLEHSSCTAVKSPARIPMIVRRCRGTRCGGHHDSQSWRRTSDPRLVIPHTGAMATHTAPWRSSQDGSQKLDDAHDFYGSELRHSVISPLSGDNCHYGRREKGIRRNGGVGVGFSVLETQTTDKLQNGYKTALRAT
jgi:hypothetical protein